MKNKGSYIKLDWTEREGNSNEMSITEPVPDFNFPDPEVSQQVTKEPPSSDRSLKLDRRCNGTLKPGWRKGLMLTSFLAGIVLFTNILCTVLAILKARPENGLRVLYEGNCERARTLNSGLHILINILSTALIGASNYTMQVLGSPTRKEIDRAHKADVWLSIGAPNFRNIRWIPWKRRILFGLLFISAWPLHLLWNSVVFSTLQANQYGVLVVTSDFVTSEIFDDSLLNLNLIKSHNPVNTSAIQEFRGFSLGINNIYTGSSIPTGFNDTTFLNFSTTLYNQSKDPKKMEILSKSDCMKSYSQTFLSTRRNLIVVVNKTVSLLNGVHEEGNSSMLDYLDSRNWDNDITAGKNFKWNPGAWICSSHRTNDGTILVEEGPGNIQSKSADNPGPALLDVSEVLQRKLDSFPLTLRCDVSKSLNNIDPWIIGSSSQYQQYEVDHCLSEVVEEVCQVQFAPPIMMVVIACNAIKVICMIMAIMSLSGRPLTTLGDAVASFLTMPDLRTIGQCLVTHPAHGWVQPLDSTSDDLYKWKGRTISYHWNKAALLSWFLATSLSLVALLLATVFLIGAVHSLVLETLNSLALGAISASALITTYVNTARDITSMSFLMRMVLISNSPQLALTLLYFLNNRAYTCMLAIQEWNEFSRKRQGLRVSNPVGEQRSTYWLQLPYLYSIPLLLSSGFMHWLVSESLFIVRISFLNQNGQPASGCKWCKKTGSVLTLLGYSPKAILVAIVLGGVMYIMMVVIGMRRYKPGIPLVITSSWTIAAACHRPYNDKDAANKKVMWGAISHQDGDVRGHCTFSSSAVMEPRVGLEYE